MEVVGQAASRETSQQRSPLSDDVPEETLAHLLGRVELHSSVTSSCGTADALDNKATAVAAELSLLVVQRLASAMAGFERGMLGMEHQVGRLSERVSNLSERLEGLAEQCAAVWGHVGAETHVVA